MVELEDDTVEQSVVCVVVDVLGSVASLVHAEECETGLRDRLRAGAPGYLVFSDHGAEIGLHGVAATAPGHSSVIDFAVVDGVQVRERRTGRRAPFVTRARLLPTDTRPEDSEHAAIETFTLDLSVSGALLRYRPQLLEHERYMIELFLAAEQRPVCCQATRVRQTREGIAVHFGVLDESDRTRLVTVIAGRIHPSPQQHARAN